MRNNASISSVQSKLITSSMDNIIFKLLDSSIIENSFTCVFCAEKSKVSFYLSQIEYDRNEKIISIPSSCLIDKIKNFSFNSKWKIYLTSPENPDILYRLSNSDFEKKCESRLYNHSFLYGNPIGEFNYNGKPMIIRPCYSILGRASIELVPKDDLYLGVYDAKVLDFSLKQNKLFILLDSYPILDYMPYCITMSLRNSEGISDNSYEFPVTYSKSKKMFHIQCDVDLKELPLRPLYWDLTLDYKNSYNEVIHLRTKNFDPKFEKKYFMSFFRNDIYNLHSDLIFYPYLTFYGSLAFQCRQKSPYDGWSFRIKERLGALCYRLQKQKLIDKKIHLVYEKFCGMAQDNGFYYFKYCMDNQIEEKMDRSIYYVIDKNSPDCDKLKPYKDHVINFMSIRYIAYFLASKLLISSDTKSHAYVWRKRNSIIFQYMENKKLVFLQHGVTALKRMEYLFGKGRNGGCNLFITTSEFEKNIIREHFGYKEKEIAVTGFSRWDVLQDCSNGNRELLLMPTWRNWLEEVDEQTFIQSIYYKNYTKLLSSPQLIKLLDSYDLTLNFYIHPKFSEYLKAFHVDTDRIHLIPFGTMPLNQLLMTCRLLITDYSSVCWDVYYQKKPVIFYQFDLDDYEMHHGSYLDMKTELFGQQTEDLNKLLIFLEDACKNNFKLNQQALTDYSRYFAYSDDKNSQRICNAIMEKGW